MNPKPVENTGSNYISEYSEKVALLVLATSLKERRIQTKSSNKLLLKIFIPFPNL